MHNCSTTITVAHIKLAFTEVAQLGVWGASSGLMEAALFFLLCWCLGIRRSLLSEFGISWLLSGHGWCKLLVVLNSPESCLWVCCHRICRSHSVSSWRWHSRGNYCNSNWLVVTASATCYIMVVAPWWNSCHIHRLCPFRFLQTTVSLI